MEGVVGRKRKRWRHEKNLQNKKQNKTKIKKKVNNSHTYQIILKSI